MPLDERTLQSFIQTPEVLFMPKRATALLIVIQTSIYDEPALETQKVNPLSSLSWLCSHRE